MTPKKHPIYPTSELDQMIAENVIFYRLNRIREGKDLLFFADRIVRALMLKERIGNKKFFDITKVKFDYSNKQEVHNGDSPRSNQSNTAL